jgi:hypothetical protein
MVKSVFFIVNHILNDRIFLARICIIDKQNHNYKAVFSRLDSSQEGRCWLCSERIMEKEPIISKLNSGRSKYYHKICAERIHLL